MKDVLDKTVAEKLTAITKAYKQKKTISDITDPWQKKYQAYKSGEDACAW